MGTCGQPGYDAELNIRNFKHIIKYRDKSGKRAFGGLSVYVNQKLSEGVSYVPTKNKNAIWCKLDKTYFNFQKDIYLGTVYLSPSNFERSNSVDLIGELEVEMLHFSQRGDIVVQGDFNARTGGMQETISDDDNAFLNAPEDYEADEQYIRQSQDSGTINCRGRSLLETCTALNLRILNGRIVGDLDGKKTCFHYNGSSVVDYVIASKNILRNVQYLIVNPLKPHLSDHCHISYAIKANPARSDSIGSSSSCNLTEHNRLCWNINSKDKLERTLESQEFQSKLEEASLHDNVNIATELVSQTLVAACKIAGLKSQKQKSSYKQRKAWFDQDCETEKENLKSLGKQISRNPDNVQLRTLLHEKKKSFKKTCKRKKCLYLRKKIADIDYRNSKDTWKQIGTIFNLRKRKTGKVETVRAEEFYKYFKQQNQGPQNNCSEKETFRKSEENETGPLDYLISDEEFDVAMCKLKANKAPGIDNILNEVLKVGKDFIKRYLITLFNRILSTGKYPLLWSFGLIVPVHKKDDPSKAENYRGITLLSSLSKLFTSILNNRLYDYATKKGILKDEQGGFRKMHGTADSIFILKALIDKYVKSKSQRQRNMLFSCFVDFSKAFDRVPRNKLFDKLRTVGIKGHFLEVLISMYSNDKSAVKIENKITQTFLCHNGVKQGCMLSPTLFNIYLSDLPETLNITSTTEVMLRERPTNCLLYADDLVVFARSAKGLQRILNKLESFCEQADLNVNLDKTKVMIFNNSGKSLNNYSFRYGMNKLENAKSYRYLGLTLCPYGNFNLARQELKKASLKALFKLRKEMGNHFSENIKLTIKLFDALISPILMYGSEIWGIDCNGKLDTDPEELVQNKFLKWLLGVNKYCNNNACRAETGRFPLRIKAQCRTFKFWLTLAIHEENNRYKLSQVAYNDIKWIKDKALWSQKIKNSLYHIGLGNLWEKAHFSDVNIVSIIRQRLEDIELQRWFSEMNNDKRKDPNQSNKMRTYRKVKTIDNYRCEDYLHQVTNIRHRTTMTKLRLSNHRLAIETGRYMRPYKKPNERMCPLCKREAEDEKHFLVSCPVYQEKRKSLFECLYKEFKISMVEMTTENVFLLLLNPPSNNVELQKIIAKHIHDCYEIRQKT